MFDKIVQRIVEPGAFFFGGDVVLLGRVVSGGEDRFAPV
jgi:hypothetical protein